MNLSTKWHKMKKTVELIGFSEYLIRKVYAFSYIFCVLTDAQYLFMKHKIEEATEH